MDSRRNWQPSKTIFLSQAQLEKMVTKLKVEKAQVEASLREEEAKCGMLLKEVKDANEVSAVKCMCADILFRHLEKARGGYKARTFLCKILSRE